MTPRRPRPARPGAAARGGFTLVEVIMAVTLLAVALLALAGLGATALTAVRRGASQTVAAAVAQARIDSLASLPCDQIAPASGAATVSGVAAQRGITERWTALRLAKYSYNIMQVADTLRVPGRARAYAYMSMRACR